MFGECPMWKVIIQGLSYGIVLALQYKPRMGGGQKALAWQCPSVIRRRAEP